MKYFKGFFNTPTPPTKYPAFFMRGSLRDWDIERQDRERPLHLKVLRVLACTAILLMIIFAFHSVAHAGVLGEAADVAKDAMCAPLKKFERSCSGVKAAAATLGKGHAEWLARKCGATEHDLQDARDCFLPAVCGGQSVDDHTYTSHPECRR